MDDERPKEIYKTVKAIVGKVRGSLRSCHCCGKKFYSVSKWNILCKDCKTKGEPDFRVDE